MKLRTNAFVFARGGSKGVPGKNIRDFNGKPLLAWTLKMAGTMRETGMFDRVIVSTDSEEIADVARTHGAEVPFMRPADLATDTASEWLAWQHAISNLPPFDIMVSLPATAPLRRQETVTACVERYLRGDADMVLTVTPAAHHPSFNMARLDENDGVSILMPLESPVVRRQDAPVVFDVTTVCYVTSPTFVLNNSGALAGSTKAVIVSQEEAVDIDTTIDFEFAVFLHGKRRKSHALG